MRFTMFMIPSVYQPDAPLGERVEEEYAPLVEAIARMMESHEALAKAGALSALDELHPNSKGHVSRV
jgi:hypothetical protein